MSHLDWAPTLLAAAGETKVKEKLLTGYKSTGKNFKVHLDGYNMLPYLTGKQKIGEAAGVSFEERQDLLGHRSGRITTHYSAAELSRLIEAANSVCGRSGKKPELVVLRRLCRS